MTELIPADLTADRLTALIAPWQLVLRAERKSPQTIKTYRDGLQRYLTWCSQHAAEPMKRTTLNQWIAAMLDAGRAPGTARARQLAVRRFTAWLILEGHLAADPFHGVKAPKVDQPVVEPLSDDELRALINACAGFSPGQPDEPRNPDPMVPGKRIHHRRDEAIVRLMFETGIRCGEVVALTTADVDLTDGLVQIRRGKGGAGRVVPIGPATIDALHRYLTLRHRHRLADLSDLWLGERGRHFGYDGLSRALSRRAQRAGIQGFHPHKLRHTAAHRWLAKGGSESGLMAMAGWTRTDMLVRYTKARAMERAAHEARRLNLGDL